MTAAGPRRGGAGDGGARTVRIADLDLNLLVSLDALLRERSVTRAALRLGLSQPALSGALRRLRLHFGDQLLLRAGNDYHLSPLAVSLGPRVTAALTEIERVFTGDPDFHPLGCRREFTVVISDYALHVVGPLVVRALASSAPRARIRFRPPGPAELADARTTLTAADALVVPHGSLADLPHLEVFRDRWVCLVDAHDDRVGEQLAVDDLGAMPWVVTSQRPAAYLQPHRHLDQLGTPRDVRVVTDGFLAVPAMVAGSRRVALLPARLAAAIPPELGVRVLDCPFDAGPLVEALWWHPSSEPDPAHQLLRSAFRDAASALGAAGPVVGDRARPIPVSGRCGGPEPVGVDALEDEGGGAAQLVQLVR